MEPEIFNDTADTAWAGYKAWEARCRELGYEGPHRLADSYGACWQFVYPKGGTAAIYNAAKGQGFVFRDDDSA